VDSIVGRVVDILNFPIAKNPVRASIKNSLTVAIAMTAIAMPTLGALWQPPAEPQHWGQIRETLQGKGLMSQAKWIFFGALENDNTQAAEYLSNLQTSQGAVAFDGLLLLKRAGASEWVVRPLKMRAICAEGRLERRGQDGLWSDYSGRPDTARKVEWICRQKP